MAKLERVYNIPLRKEFMKVPSHRKANRCIVAVKEFIARHMHADIEQVRLGPALNDDIWKHGMKNPPHHVKVNVVKEEDGRVNVELVGAEAKKEKPAKEKKAKKVESPEAEEHAGHKHEEHKAESHKAEKPKTEHKKEEKPKAEKKPAAKKAEK